MIWFTSDIHWNHTNIIRYTKARHRFNEMDKAVFDVMTPDDQKAYLRSVCVPKMNKVLVDNFNSCVKPDDEVYILGDLCFGGDVEGLLKSLNGKKHLIIGNHDKRHIKKVYKTSPDLVWVRDYYSLRFICPVTHQPQMAVMCHYPFAVWEEAHHGTWCLHGHSHGTYNPEHGKILDVGVDSHDLMPWSLTDIAQYMSTRSFKKLDHHDEDTNI